MPDTECPKSRSEVIFRPLDDSWVLFDPRAGKLHVLNLSAALIWTHLDGETSCEAIAEAVGTSFSPPRDVKEVFPDVLETVERFWEAGLLDTVSHS